MQHDYALPKFESPAARRQKIIKWALIGGGGLVVVQLVVVAAVVISRNQAAQEDAARVLLVAQEQAARAQEQATDTPAANPAASALAAVPPMGETADQDLSDLPPRAEEDQRVSKPAKSRQVSKNTAKSRRARKAPGRLAIQTKARSSAAASGQKRMKNDEIDKLLSQFR